MRGRQQVLDVTRAGWADQLPADVGAAFDEDLRRLGKREPTARALLAALAWAKGPGLPWERSGCRSPRRWPPTPGPAHRRSTTTRCGGCWTTPAPTSWRTWDRVSGRCSGPSTTCWPPTCAASPATTKPPPTPPSGTLGSSGASRSSGTSPACCSTASDLLRRQADWELAHPYLRTYLAQHAHAAGPDTFAELVADLDYLAVADPTILTPLLSPTDPALRWVARSYRRARPLLGRSARDNAAYLQEAVVAQTGSHPTGQRIRPTYRTLMARVRRDDSLLTLTGHHRHGCSRWRSGSAPTAGRCWPPPATTGRCGCGTRPPAPRSATHCRPHRRGVRGGVRVGADGRPLLASAGGDGTVRLWDPATGAPVGEPLRGHTGPVSAVAFGIDERRPAPAGLRQRRPDGAAVEPRHRRDHRHTAAPNKPRSSSHTRHSAGYRRFGRHNRRRGRGVVPDRSRPERRGHFATRP